MTAAGGPDALVCVTGRFQPVHEDHLRLFRAACTDGDRLVVALTNPDPGSRPVDATSEHRHRADANPFTYYERVELLTAALSGDDRLPPGAAARVRLVPFDLARPEHWCHYVPLSAVQYVGVHGAWEREKARRLGAQGYRVVEVRGEGRSRRTSTAIRSALRAGHDWERLVPPATVPVLRGLLADRRAAGREL